MEFSALKYFIRWKKCQIWQIPFDVRAFDWYAIIFESCFLLFSQLIKIENVSSLDFILLSIQVQHWAHFSQRRKRSVCLFESKQTRAVSCEKSTTIAATSVSDAQTRRQYNVANFKRAFDIYCIEFSDSGKYMIQRDEPNLLFQCLLASENAVYTKVCF